MSGILALLLCVVIKDLRIRDSEESPDAYLQPSNTYSVLGLFTVLVFFSHYVTYIPTGGLDTTYLALKKHLGQMVVVPFFFFSGYGMTVSIIKKGSGYLRSVICKRIPSVLLSFVVAVLFYWLLQTIRGNTYTPEKVLLSFIGWHNLGNSNWFIFGILGEYLLFFLSFLLLIIRKSQGNNWLLLVGAALLTGLSLLFVLWIKSQGRPAYCYNTLMLFPAGVWWGLLHKYPEQVLRKNNVIFGSACLLALMVYSYAYFRRARLLWYTVWGCMFMALLLLFIMKMSVSSPLLKFFGRHVFSIYILQRIPMIVLSDLKWTNKLPYVCLAIALVSTCLMAVLFDRGKKKAERIIWPPGRKPLTGQS